MNIVITTIEAVLQKMISKKALYKNTLNFKVGDSENLETIKQKLVELGYVRCDLIEGRGQFSVRGGIVDISVNEKEGVRLEFWGDEIEKIVEQKTEWIQKTIEKENKKQEKEALYTKEKFKEIIEKNANELIQKTGLKPNKINIKQIKYAWGSCSSKKNITLNLELIKYNQEAIRYVILHELCHIKHMNHSKEFWNLVEKYMPNYKQVKKEFK